jgi:hypothetical protein
LSVGRTNEMSRVSRVFALVAIATLVLTPSAGSAVASQGEATATRVAADLGGGFGTGVGPGGDVYVVEGPLGRISRFDTKTGEVSTFASGLPAALPYIGIGGVADVAFIGSTAYFLVTLAGVELGGTAKSGLYRLDGPSSYTLIADIGAYSAANPPNSSYLLSEGVQYSLEAYRGGFLVADGHHNRVLHVTLDGTIEEIIAFGNVVTVGLEVWGNTVYLAMAGPVPHLPEDGKVVSFSPDGSGLTTVASGARLLTDVERGRGTSMYALSQGVFTPGNPEGSPANPGTGSFLRLNDGGGFTVLVEELDRPTSFEVLGDSAYVYTLTGELWRVDGI